MTDPEMTPHESTPDADTSPDATDSASEEAMPASTAPPTLPPRAHEADPRYPLPPSPQQDRPQARMPFVAALCSLFPGLGNIYNGLYTRGITFFVICFGLIGMASSARVEARVILVFAAIFVWLFNIFDAYRQATFINYGYLPGQMPARPQVPSWGSGGLTLGVAVFLLGFYFFLHNRFDFDLSLIFDNADILVMAFGAFLIGRWVLERKKAAAADDTSDRLTEI